MKFLKYSYPRYLIYHIIIICYIAFHYRKSPHSIIFREDPDLNLKKLNEQNRFKVNNARSVLQQVSDLNLNSTINTEHSIVIITTRRLADDNDRSGIGYLTRVLAHLHLATNRTNLFNINVLICDVNSDIAVHIEAYKFSQYFKTIHRFYDNDTNQRISHSIKDPFHREGLDYSFCLSHALKDSNAKYITVLEDDAVPVRNMIWNLEFHLFPRSDWYYAKTYYPPQWSGFTYDCSSIFSLLYIGCIAGIIHTTIMLISLVIICHATNYKLKRKLREIKIHSILFTHGFIFSVVVALVMGRINVNRVLGDSIQVTEHAPDCCTPMVVYTRRAAIDVVNLLKTKRCTSTNAVDLVISKFAENKSTLLMQPNQVTHIGYLSTIKGFTTIPDYFV